MSIGLKNYLDFSVAENNVYKKTDNWNKLLKHSLTDSISFYLEYLQDKIPSFIEKVCIFPNDFSIYKLKSQQPNDNSPCFIKYDSRYGFILVKYSSNCSYTINESTKYSVWEPFDIITNQKQPTKYCIFDSPGLAISTQTNCSISKPVPSLVSFSSAMRKIIPQDIACGDTFGKAPTYFITPYMPDMKVKLETAKSKDKIKFMVLKDIFERLHCVLSIGVSSRDSYIKELNESVPIVMRDLVVFNLVIKSPSYSSETKLGYAENNGIDSFIYNNYSFLGIEEDIRWQIWNLDEVSKFWKEYKEFQGEKEEETMIDTEF